MAEKLLGYKIANPVLPSLMPMMVPGAVAAVPAVPPGKDNPTSEFGFLYGEIQGIASAGPGIVPSGTLSYGVEIPLTVSPTGAGNLKWSVTQSLLAHSGARGIRLDRPAGENSAHSMALLLGGVPQWETSALDFDSSILPGPDLVLAYAHLTGDPGDHIRLSQATLANGGVKTIIGGEKVGTPAAQSTVLSVWSPTGAGTPVGGLAIHNFNDSNAIEILQRSASSDQAMIVFNQKARIAFDAPKTQDDLFRVTDVNAGHSTPSAGNKQRLVVGMPNQVQGRVSLNTDIAQGLFDIRGEAATGATVIFNRYLIGARTDNGAPNRSFVLGQQTSTAGTDNLLLLSGDMDAASVIGTPSINSSTSHGSAWWFDSVNNISHLIASPNGTNQAIAKSFSWSQAAGAPKLGFYGTAPSVKLAVTGSRGANAALASLLTQLAALGLITDSSS